jgi:hypothetical protein
MGSSCYSQVPMTQELRQSLDVSTISAFRHHSLVYTHFRRHCTWLTLLSVTTRHRTTAHNNYLQEYWLMAANTLNQS